MSAEASEAEGQAAAAEAAEAEGDAGEASGGEHVEAAAEPEDNDGGWLDSFAGDQGTEKQEKDGDAGEPSKGDQMEVDPPADEGAGDDKPAAKKDGEGMEVETADAGAAEKADGPDAAEETKEKAEGWKSWEEQKDGEPGAADVDLPAANAVEEVEEEEDDTELPGAARLTISKEDAGWVLEEGAGRVKMVEDLLLADIRVKPSGRVKLLLKDGAPESLARSEQCLRALASLRQGTDLEVYPLTDEGDDGPLLTVVDVPERASKHHIRGQGGFRLRELLADRGVISAFVVEGAKPEGASATEEAAKPAEPEPVEVGSVVQAKFGAEWCDATVLAAGEVIIKVKWSFDGTEEQVVRSNVRKKEVPREEVDKLLLFGPHRARMEARAVILSQIEKKAPGFCASKPPQLADASDDNVGLAVVQLQEEGKALPKLIGKGGSMRRKVSSACGGFLEFVGTAAHIVGTREERATTAALVELLQESDDNHHIKGVPAALEKLSLQFQIPGDTLAGIFGPARTNMQRIEDESGTIIFVLEEPGGGSLSSTAAPAGPAPSTPPEVAQADKDAEGKEPSEGKDGGEAKEKDAAEEKDAKMEDKEEAAEGLNSEEEREKKAKEVDGKGGEDAAPQEGQPATPPLDNAAEASKEGEQLASKFRTVVVIGATPEARRVAELRLAVGVEAQRPGTYGEPAAAAEGADSAEKPTHSLGADCTVDSRPAEDAEVLRCEGEAGGARLDRAAAAAGCVIQLVGSSLYFAGDASSRERGRVLLRPLLVANPGAAIADDMTDVRKIFVPNEKKCNLVEHVLAGVEKEFGVLVYFDDGASLAGMEDSTRAVVCGADGARRDAAAAKLRELQEIKPKVREVDPLEEFFRERVTTNLLEAEGSPSRSRPSLPPQDDTFWGTKGDSKSESWSAKDSGDAWAAGGDKWGKDKGSESKDKDWEQKDWGKKDAKDKNSWEKGEAKQEWDKKSEWDSKADAKNEWDKNKSSDDKKGDWGQKSAWDKKEEWGKKDEWAPKEEKKWDKKEEWKAQDDKWAKKDTQWEAKEDKWDKKEDKKDDWGAKEDKWAKKDDWGKKEEKWEKPNQWSAKEEEKKDEWSAKPADKWAKKDDWEQPKSWEKKADPWEKKDEQKWDKKGGDKWGEKQEDSEQGKSWDSKRGWEQEQKADSATGSGQRPSWEAKEWEAKKPLWVPKPSEEKPAPWARQQDDDAAGAKRRRLDWQDTPTDTRSSPIGKRPWNQEADQLPVDGGASGRKVAKVAPGGVGQPRPPSVAPPMSRLVGARPSTGLSKGAYVGHEVLYAEESSSPTDPKVVLATFENFPANADDWLMVQDTVWKNHVPLPEGWIRCWSRTYDCEYYARLEDNFTTFDREEVG